MDFTIERSEWATAMSTELNSNSEFLVNQLKHDSGRLRDFCSHWKSEHSDFSATYLANGILERSECVRRHLIESNELSDAAIEAAKFILANASDLLKSDPRIANQSLAHLTTNKLSERINEFEKIYLEGIPFEECLQDLAFDIIDVYLSFELILSGLYKLDLTEEMAAKRETLSWRLASIHERLKFICSINKEFAAISEEYAINAPGGIEMDPWRDLLEETSDEREEAVLSDFLKIQSQTNLNLYYLTQPFALAADSERTFIFDEQALPHVHLFKSKELWISLVEYDNKLVILYSGKGIEKLPAPIARISDKAVGVEKADSGFTPGIGYILKLDLGERLDGSLLEISIPGPSANYNIKLIQRN